MFFYFALWHGAWAMSATSATSTTSGTRTTSVYATRCWIRPTCPGPLDNNKNLNFYSWSTMRKLQQAKTKENALAKICILYKLDSFHWEPGHDADCWAKQALSQHAAVWLANNFQPLHIFRLKFIAFSFSFTFLLKCFCMCIFAKLWRCLNCFRHFRLAFGWSSATYPMAQSNMQCNIFIFCPDSLNVFLYRNYLGNFAIDMELQIIALIFLIKIKVLS